MGGARLIPACLPKYRPVEDGQAIVGEFSLAQLSMVLGAGFMTFALVLSIGLLELHANHFSKKLEQTRIMRLILIIPFYAILSFLTLLLRDHGAYILTWLDVWASLALVNFYQLLCSYAWPNEQRQKDYFTRNRKAYLTFRVTWVLVLQWVPMSLATSIAVVVTNSTATYCNASLGLEFAKIYITSIKLASASVAISGLIYLTTFLNPLLSPHHLWTKLWSLVALVGISSLSQFVLGILATSNIENSLLSLDDLSYSLPALIISGFTCFHIMWFLSSFNHGPYAVPTSAKYVGGTWGMSAMLHAVNPAAFLLDVGQTTMLLFRAAPPETQASHVESCHSGSEDLVAYPYMAVKSAVVHEIPFRGTPVQPPFELEGRAPRGHASRSQSPFAGPPPRALHKLGFFPSLPLLPSHQQSLDREDPRSEKDSSSSFDAAVASLRDKPLPRPFGAAMLRNPVASSVYDGTYQPPRTPSPSAPAWSLSLSAVSTLGQEEGLPPPRQPPLSRGQLEERTPSEFIDDRIEDLIQVYASTTFGEAL